MKPKIFLSHSKKDKAIIEKIANDIRYCGIDVWYDEWEIPPGESIRKKIFEDGIPNCDSFFVYLTPNSIDAYWVQKELDSAVIRESEDKNSFLILFVDKDETRQKLPYDLKALNIPSLNEENYLVPLSKLISKTWQAFAKKMIAQQSKAFEQEKLSIEREKFELEKQLFNLKKSGLINLEKVKEILRSKAIKSSKISNNYLDTFAFIKYKLADGATTPHLTHVIAKRYELEERSDFISRSKADDEAEQLVGELIIQGIVSVVPQTNEFPSYNTLSELGIQLARQL